MMTAPKDILTELDMAALYPSKLSKEDLSDLLSRAYAEIQAMREDVAAAPDDDNPILDGAL